MDYKKTTVVRTVYGLMDYKKTPVVRTVWRKLNELRGDKPGPCDHNRFRMAPTVVREEQ